MSGAWARTISLRWFALVYGIRLLVNPMIARTDCECERMWYVRIVQIVPICRRWHTVNMNFWKYYCNDHINHHRSYLSFHLNSSWLCSVPHPRTNDTISTFSYILSFFYSDISLFWSVAYDYMHCKCKKKWNSFNLARDLLLFSSRALLLRKFTLIWRKWRKNSFFVTS